MTDKRILPTAAVSAMAIQMWAGGDCSRKGKMEPITTLPAPCFGPSLVMFFLDSILLQSKELIPVIRKDESGLCVVCGPVEHIVPSR